MRVSVIGCGNISRCHLQALDKMDSVEISSVADIRRDRADAAAEKYGCKAYYDYEKMLIEDKPDTVHICTPHYLHVPMAVKALSMGINVLCEKPCAISLDSLKSLRLAQTMSGAKFGVCFQNRYNESVIAVKNLLDSGIYGKIISARATVNWCRDEDYYNDDWHGKLRMEGGGVLVNQAVHTEDLLRYLVGKDIVSVDGHVFNDHLKGKIEVEDTATARFEFEDGMIALYYATTAFSINAGIMIDIFCEKATLRIEGNNAYVSSPDAQIKQLHIDENTSFAGKSYWGNGHESLISDFYDCLNTGRKFPIDAYEGGKAVEEFLAIYSSSEIGEKVSIKR